MAIVDTGPPDQSRSAHIRELIQRGSLPCEGATTALRLVRLLGDWVTVAQIAEEAQKSPPLVSGIRRLATSVHYGGPAGATLEQAIEFLGLVEVRRLALTLAASSWTRTDSASGLYNPAWLRRRTTVMACTSESLATAIGATKLFAYYEAGTYADLGFMFLASHLPKPLTDARIAALRPGGPPISHAEVESYGCTHADVSAVAAQMHDLPLQVVEAVQHHHAPWAAGHAQPLADVVHVASVETDAAAIQPVFGWPAADCDRDAYDRLGLTREQAQEIAAEARETAARYFEAVPARAA